jgi:hypothetical protein
MTAESPEVLSGFEALARVARAVCGRAVSRSPAEAEGLALAGLRAASLSDGVATARGAGIALPSASCVHHVRGAPGREPFGAFEFASASAQEAIDHSLAAHRLSGDIGRPGLCSLDPSIGERLNLVRVPGAELIADALGTPAPHVEDDRLLERAREALRSIAERTGRPVDVVDRSGEDGAKLALIGSGAGAARAREAARALCAAGVPATAVSVNLVRPFPDLAVRDALAKARTVLVVEAPDAADGLLARVQTLVDGQSAVHPAVPSRLLATVAEHVPESSLGPDLLAPQQRPPSHRLAVLPAGPWGEETARRLAALLGQLGPLRLARRLRRSRGASVLAWESDALAQDTGDLLVAADPANLEPRALCLLRPHGAVVVVSPAASSDDLIGLLSAETLTILRERELAMLWVPPPEVAGCEADGAADGATGLALAGGALVALASAGELPDAAAAEQVAARLEGAGSGEQARWLLEGARRARFVERAALDASRHVEEVDFRSARTLPRLPDPVDDPAERERWAGLIRRFHRTGRPAFGAGSRGATRPAALGDLAEAVGGSRHHPFVLVPAEDPEAGITARGLCDVLAEAAFAVQAAGREARVLVDNTERLAFLVSRLLARSATAADLGGLLDQAGPRLAGELELSEADERTLSEDLAELRGRAPVDGLVFASSFAICSSSTACALARAARPKRSRRPSEARRRTASIPLRWRAH